METTNVTNKKLASYYEIPSLKGKETSGADELEYLFDKTQDPVFGKTLELRRLNTILKNYIPNWKPKEDGRVHTTWGYKASSGQLDSSAPNVLNISKHTALGQRFRRIIVAPEGYSFVEADKKSFHVATLGYLAEDKDYLRFASLDPHSIFTSYIMPPSWGKPVSFGWSDGDILLACKEIKKQSKREKEKTGIDIRQDVAKPCVLGNQLGLGPYKLWYKNRRSIKSKAHAEELQKTLAALFPKVERWKEETIELAHKQTYLIDPWGHIQFFFEIYTWQKDKYSGRWTKKRTNEAEQALALMVQGTAFGMLKFQHIEMERDGLNEKYNFINSIHDSLQFMPEDRYKESCIADSLGYLNRPCPRLVNEATGPQGLVVKVEVANGRNLADWGESNLEGMREI